MTAPQQHCMHAARAYAGVHACVLPAANEAERGVHMCNLCNLPNANKLDHHYIINMQCRLQQWAMEKRLPAKKQTELGPSRLSEASTSDELEKQA
jgi:hypothetical protein